ncbi:acyl-CoA synthetase (AMP-forming)/AMP-acid ligase II (plasmid) [Cylindrospermum stagnale PCC 7417]|uniref:Acyl-CoA synthetase (AMP-forming)/AMP-acid ligase II n=1 Tax=Cylindrospermum stagnale PCC 7417 TaxID=56107 RepID=K9X829_9NOST|nr:SDR family NAD(P)-dependent oxidoreductase [Cylindrospermum stagnale]AFZ28231.1 acyl-CoA synthetase (AMP-forming)/AMP-acid ligase II [Cylindrospermum stagnale PCC 7417]
MINNFSLNIKKIEAALLSEPSVNDCVVVVRETVKSTEELVAYIVSSKPLLSQQLDSYLKNIIPASEIPNAFVFISSLPLTPEGLVDQIVLEKLVFINTKLKQKWEKKLQENLSVEEVAVITKQTTEFIQPFPLPKLLTNQESNTSSHIISKQLVSESEEVVTKSKETKTSKLAISNGGHLTIPEESPKTLIDALLQTATKHPNKGMVYIQSNNAEIFQSYASLLLDAKRILTGLHSIGLKPKQKVILQIKDLQFYFPAFWACLLGGIIPVTVAIAPTYDNRNNVVDKLFNIWKFLECPPILASEALVESISNSKNLLPISDIKIFSIETLINNPTTQAIYQSQPDDIAFLQLTSGSTGIPKCVQQSHENIISHIHASQQFNGYESENITLNWLPVDHVVPLLTYHLKDVYLGCQQIEVSTNFILGNPLKWLDLIEQYQVTHSWSPNFGFKLVSNELKKVKQKTWDLFCLKFLMNAGEQVTFPVVDEFLDLVAPFKVSSQVMQPAFGMAEVCTCMTYQNNFTEETGIYYFKKSSLNSILEIANKNEKDVFSFIDLGPAVPGVQIRIVDNNNQLVFEKVIGRLQIKGTVVMPGYLSNVEANEESFVGEGWFNTGDLGFIFNGHLIVAGREKEQIIINGANYYCYEIEELINGINGIVTTYVAVCGIQNLETGTEDIAIFYTPIISGIKENIELIKNIRSQLTSCIGINPRYIIPIQKSKFPKTTSGKIQRTQLQKQFVAGDFQEVLQEIDIYLNQDKGIPDWFYQKIWRRKEILHSFPEISAGFYLLFLDSSGLGESLGAKLNQPWIGVEMGTSFAKLSANRYCINPQNPADYQQLLDSLSQEMKHISQILHLWTYKEYVEEVSSLEMLEKAQVSGVWSLLFLVQALAKTHNKVNKIQLMVVSTQSQGIDAKDLIAYENTPLLGLLKTIPHEIPWLSCRHVDLQIDLQSTPVNINRELVLRELKAVTKEPEITYRQETRWIPRLKKIDVTQNFPEKIPFRQGGMYVITGGLGGIGKKLATYLLKNFQARLLLLGRTSLPPQNEWASYLVQNDKIAERIQSFQTLKQLGGEICYETLDVCDLHNLDQVVQKAQSLWQCSLDGVIHLAGIFQERLLIEETQETFAQVMYPKVLGTWSLYQLIKNKPDALFITSSSVNGFFGGAMVGAYAAANRFQEHFSHNQISRNIKQSYCFNWSQWDEVGISRGYSMKILSRNRGYLSISDQQGLESFLIGLCYSSFPLWIGLSGKNPYIRGYLESKPENVEQLVAYVVNKISLDEPKGFLSNQNPEKHLSELVLSDCFGTLSTISSVVELKEMPLTATGVIDYQSLVARINGFSSKSGKLIQPNNEMENQIAQIWKNILGFSEISIHDSIFAIGGSSLKMIQIHHQLEDSLGQKFSITEMFQYPTIHTLAKHLAQFSIVLNNSQQNNELDKIRDRRLASNLKQRQRRKVE